MIGDEQLPALPTSPPAVEPNLLAQLFGAPAVTANTKVNKPQEPMGKSYSGQGKPPAQEDPLLAMLRSFFEELNKPFDPNDPEVQLILRNARENTLQSAGNAGIFGPYSQNLAEQAYFKAAAPLAMQRKGMAANALGMYTGATQNQRDYDYRKSQDDWQRNMDLWNIEQQNSPGAQIGAGIGGVAGGIAGFFGGDIAGGAQAGMNIGRGIGQGFSYTPPPAYRPPGGY